MAVEPWDRPNDVIEATNLVPNPSFETSTLGWEPKYSGIGSLQQTSNSFGVAVGARALLITGTSSPSSANALIQSEAIPASPGDWVSVAASMRCGLSTPVSAMMRIYWTNESGATSESDSVDVTARVPLASTTNDLSSNRLFGDTVQVPSGFAGFRLAVWFRAADGVAAPPSGFVAQLDAAQFAVGQSSAVATAQTATYFDGDTPSGESDNDPHYRWTGTPHASTSEKYLPARQLVTGVTDIGISTDSRLGIVADVYSRSREKINLELAGVDRQLIAGERIELAAAAMTASSNVWHWRQVTGPPVKLEPRESNVDFIAPDVSSDTPVRIGVYAVSEDGRNRSDWHYFDLTIQPALARFRDSDGGDYTPVSPKYVGYDRGKREIWNDVIAPPTFTEKPRHEVEKIDLGIVPDDVQFSTAPPERAAAGGIYIDPTTGDIYRNFGAGYNETDDTLAAPRTNAWWVNPATGDILEWIED